MNHDYASGFCLTTDQLFCFPERLSRCFPMMILYISQIRVIVYSVMNRCSKSGIHEHSPNSQIHVQIFHRIAKLSSTDFPDHKKRRLPKKWNMCGDIYPTSGHSDFGIFNNVDASSILTWLQADDASAACPEHPGSLDIMSMTFAAVIWDADDPCSVNTAYEPESPRSTTLPLYFWYLGSSSEC